ncbi:MAG TPA: bifunctional 4-hydroxy-2-oxoglutarate aldolase/2-dehydro-3-deoxy-phosphogluconate aldolase, partial [Vicinamibacteria bacterium]|nr:bifunctional 4-hydroxy-2-oxoglutarate aldolase/2-dehydro-3-deoxy-phosphogluconate aldolase [Vicinamibacteria bacterium]
MDKKAVLERITGTGLIPVIRAQSADEAQAVVEAIQAGGLSILEITMTVPNAVKLIEQVVSRAEDALVGAGTVLDAETACACIAAGARFVVSPALNLDTVRACNEAGVAVLPGALTPTEVVTAWRAGADLVKVFPANAVGGAAYIKSLKAPLPQVGLVPTGGVNLQTAKEFIKAG